MKRKYSKEVKIGIAVIISILILYFGINFLKGINIFKPTNSYMVAFDNVSELTVSSPVLLNGYQIGLVHSMELDKNNPGKIIAIINLNKGVKIPKGSKVELVSSMLGSASITVTPDYSVNDYFSTNDTIQGTRKGDMLTGISDNMIPQIVDLLPKIDTILVSLSKVISDPAITKSVSDMAEITDALKKSSQQMNLLITSVNKDIPTITSNFVSISENLDKVSSDIKSMDLNNYYNSIDSTLKNIQFLSDKLNSKDNSIGLLMNDRQLYDSITSTLNNASLLLKDVKENPSRYINVKVF